MIVLNQLRHRIKFRQTVCRYETAVEEKPEDRVMMRQSFNTNKQWSIFLQNEAMRRQGMPFPFQQEPQSISPSEELSSQDSSFHRTLSHQVPSLALPSSGSERTNRDMNRQQSETTLEP